MPIHVCLVGCLGPRPANTRCCQNVSRTLKTFPECPNMFWLFSRKRIPSPLPNLFLGNTILHCVKLHKHLGIILSQRMDWSEHIAQLHSKVMSVIHSLTPFKYKLDRCSLKQCVQSFVIPLFDYGDILYDNCVNEKRDLLENAYLAAIRLITGAKRGTSHHNLYQEIGWCTLKQRRDSHKLQKIFDIINGYTPLYLKNILPRQQQTYRTRQATCNYVLYKCKTELYRNSFMPSAIRQWNNSPSDTKSIVHRRPFKYRQKQSLYKKTPAHFNCSPRKYNVILSQMRMGFCDLKYYLHIKGCIDNPNCIVCGVPETLHHFFFECPSHDVQRQHLLNSVSAVIATNNQPIPTNVNLLIDGSDVSSEQSMSITKIVIDFIKNVHRF